MGEISLQTTYEQWWGVLGLSTDCCSKCKQAFGEVGRLYSGGRDFHITCSNNFEASVSGLSSLLFQPIKTWGTVGCLSAVRPGKVGRLSKQMVVGISVLVIS